MTTERPSFWKPDDLKGSEMSHHHHHEYYSESDPEVISRLDALKRQNDLIIQNQEFLMSQADDLNNALTSLATGYSALHDAVQVEIDALLKALATITQPDPATAAAITAAVSNITAITGTMATDAAKLTASVPAATTVPPPVVVPPVVPPTADIPVIATPAVTDPSAKPPSVPPANATTT
jgi:hypothetical protein